MHHSLYFLNPSPIKRKRKKKTQWSFQFTFPQQKFQDTFKKVILNAEHRTEGGCKRAIISLFDNYARLQIKTFGEQSSRETGKEEKNIITSFLTTDVDLKLAWVGCNVSNILGEKWERYFLGTLSMMVIWWALWGKKMKIV